MNEVAHQAVKEIEAMKGNKVIADFVTSEALAKVASELNAKTGGATTAKGVQVLSYRHKKIAERVEHYIELGFIGCLMAKYAA